MIFQSPQQIDKFIINLIRSKYTQETEDKLSRILHGQNLGVYTLSEAERNEVSQYQTDVESFRTQGKELKKQLNDELKLIEYQNALHRLSQPKIQEKEKVTPIFFTKDVFDDKGTKIKTEQVLNPILQKDLDERKYAQLIVDSYEITIKEAP